MVDLQRALAVAREACATAGDIAMRHFRDGVAVEWKSDASPVTAADREAETAIVAIIRSAFPDHAILGEETGSHGGSTARWLVDPIDGTRGFAAGGMFWGPLVALEHGGQIVAGALGLPVVGEFYAAARGLGCWRGSERVRLSTVARWGDAVISLGELRRIAARFGDARLLEVLRSCASARSFGDVGAAVMLLSGRADVWIEAGVSPWDVAPHHVLVAEAGGRTTDVSDSTGSAIIATNGALHDHALELLGCR